MAVTQPRPRQAPSKVTASNASSRRPAAPSTLGKLLKQLARRLGDRILERLGIEPQFQQPVPPVRGQIRAGGRARRETVHEFENLLRAVAVSDVQHTRTHIRAASFAPASPGYSSYSGSPARESDSYQAGPRAANSQVSPSQPHDLANDTGQRPIVVADVSRSTTTGSDRTTTLGGPAVNPMTLPVLPEGARRVGTYVDNQGRETGAVWAVNEARDQGQATLNIGGEAAVQANVGTTILETNMARDGTDRVVKTHAVTQDADGSLRTRHMVAGSNDALIENINPDGNPRVDRNVGNFADSIPGSEPSMSRSGDERQTAQRTADNGVEVQVGEGDVIVSTSGRDTAIDNSRGRGLGDAAREVSVDAAPGTQGLSTSGQVQNDMPSLSGGNSAGREASPGGGAGGGRSLER